MNLTHPYGNLEGGMWMRGNLHTHSTQSDGDHDPQAVINKYAEFGHGFLMLSDHEFLTSENMCKALDARGLILLPGLEIGGGPHLLYVDAECAIAPKHPRQTILNRIAELRRKNGRGFAIMNHPNWLANFNHATIEQLMEWVDYAGIEIFNGVINRLEGSAYALDKWDMLLSAGRRVWGYANDDCHKLASDAGQGWNVVYAYERTVAGVADALANGRFYASSGVVITNITVDGRRIRIETENAERIAAIQNHGKRILVVDQNRIEVDAPLEAKYVRFECWGGGEAMAWTQPFFIEASPAATRRAPGMKGWQASGQMLYEDLSGASPEAAGKHSFTDLAPSTVAAGFTDLRDIIAGADCAVYAKAGVNNAEKGQGLMRLGYDGPVRVWLNGKEVFHGPGTNPAEPDRVRLYVDLQQGKNEVLIALHSNGGKAWGFWCCLEQNGKVLE